MQKAAFGFTDLCFKGLGWSMVGRALGLTDLCLGFRMAGSWGKLRNDKSACRWLKEGRSR